MSDRRLWGLSSLGFALLFLATAHWWGIASVDTEAANLAGWRFAHSGSFDLTGVPDLPSNPFLVEVGDRLYAGRTAGVILLGLPAQLLLAPLDVAAATPGTLTAVLVTAAALATLVLLLRDLGGSTRLAVACTTALGLGTAVWTVASAELWTHTGTILWMALLLRAASRGRWSLVALWTVPLVWTRPHLVAVPVLIGLVVSGSGRSWRPAGWAIGGAAAALLSLMSWHAWLYGEASVSGPFYGQYTGPRLAAGGPGAVRGLLEGVAGTLVSPSRGVLLYSPVLLVAAAAAVAGWACAPAWVRGAALGGLGYFAVQLKVNSFVGGTAFFGNRLVLEPLIALAPLAFVGYRRLRQGRPWLVVTTRLLVAVSIAVHATGALFAGAAANHVFPLDAWHTWQLGAVLSDTGPAGLALAGLILALALLLASPLRPLGALGVEQRRPDPIGPRL